MMISKLSMETPRSLAEKHMQLAADYAAASTSYELVAMRRASMWKAIREKVNSDKAADREYEATEDGKTEIALRLRMKAIEKQIGAIKSMLSVMDGESRNSY